MTNNPAPQRRCALVAGALGLVGSRLLVTLHNAGWSTVGISRNAMGIHTEFDKQDKWHRHLQLDLSDAQDCQRQLAPLAGEITHVFFAARATDPDPAREINVNLNLLTNLLDALEGGAASAIKHLCLVHGTKWYGSHLGPYATPAREEDPRCDAGLFYYAQHDEMRRRSQHRGWSWSTVRPHIVLGVGTQYPHNCIGLLAAYGTLCKAMDLPFSFPGSQDAFNAISQSTDADLLARAMLWSATDARAANEDFNVINGDYFRWRLLWPRLAEFFDLPSGPIRPMSLERAFSGVEATWLRIVADNGLKPLKLKEFANWRFGDFLFAAAWDDMSSTIKLREHGFHDTISTEASFIGNLQQMRAARLIP